MAKIIVGVTIIEFLKGGAQIWGGGEIDPFGLCTQGYLYHVKSWFQGFQFQFFKNMYLFNIIMTRCLSDIKDLRVLQLLHRNVKLMFSSPSLLFYLDVLESFSNYYFVMFSLLLLLEFLLKTLYNELIMTLPIWF